MRTMHGILYLFTVLMIHSAAQAGDMPDPADHEFNPVISGQFKGRDQMLKTVDQKSFNVYVTGPEDARKGILLIHEWWGLNDHIRSWADRFAAMGYRAVAIDLYGGRITRDKVEAGRLMKTVDQTQANRKLKAAIDWLRAPGRRLVTLGWCFGGGQSLRATLQAPGEIAGTIIYYGQPVLDVDRLRTIQGPVLGLYAKQDGWITPDVVKSFQQAMRAAGKTLEVHSYDARHAFANPSGGRYNSDAARQAWKEVLAFLARVMDY
ncbi:MAG TPA: dienelactone hydrolase family protein [Gammaproteobacteria bacterium]|nr:dienelactone hydrolase family protein [Gammaproteobacteria bacterium]